MERRASLIPITHILAIKLPFLMLLSHVAFTTAASGHVADLTVVHDAVEKGAVCLDGSPPAYNLDRGVGSGANSWLIDIEGGGWCDTVPKCNDRAGNHFGSSRFMGKKAFDQGILSPNQDQNPGFYNWNRVYVRYCDGASFTGDVEEVNERTGNLYFRGQRIWDAVMKDLLEKGMDNARQALLTGCSAGALATILHCDKFRQLMPPNITVKCMADAGFFIDVKDISENYSLQRMYNQTVTLHGSAKNLDPACTSKMNAGLCFFPQYILPAIRTPLFILNSAYDHFQVRNSLVPSSTDPSNNWILCKQDITNCTPSQLTAIQGFRNAMLSAVQPFEGSHEGGLFMSSCYAHCQSNFQMFWLSPNSPTIRSKTISGAITDWYFDGNNAKYIDCPYPCRSGCVAA